MSLGDLQDSIMEKPELFPASDVVGVHCQQEHLSGLGRDFRHEYEIADHHPLITVFGKDLLNGCCDSISVHHSYFFISAAIQFSNFGINRRLHGIPGVGLSSSIG